MSDSAKMATPKPPRKRDSIEVRRAIECVRHGHPPVISLGFMGYVYCARCEAHIGDRLAGVFDMTDKCIVGHDCDVCRKVWNDLTPDQRRLTPNPFKGNGA